MKGCQTCLSMLLLVAMLFVGKTAYASGNPWYDDYIAYESVHGSDYTSTADVAFLAWQEGMMLRSYLNLYEATKDTSWLTKFQNHFDTVKGYATDVDGDDYLDWVTPRYAPNLVSNPNFEAGNSADATLPRHWVRNGSTSTTVFRTNAPGTYVSGGSCSTDAWGLNVTTNGSTLQSLYHVTSAYDANHPYQFSLYGKKAGSVDGYAYVYDRTDNVLLASIKVTSSSWKSYTATFTSPAAAGHRLEVWLTTDATSPANATVYYDNVGVFGFYSYQVLDGIIGIPAANFVRLVNQNATTLSAFQTKADEYQTFLEDDIIAKWEDSGAYYGDTWVNVSATEGYYKEPANHDTFSTATSLDPLPYNQFFALAEIQHILYDVNGNAAYLDKSKKAAQYFKNRLTTNGTAYSWYYADFAGSKLEDASHINVDMEFIEEMYKGGDIFTSSDMEKFTDTLTAVMWNQSTSAPQIYNEITGVNGNYCTAFMFTDTMYGWIPYAQFDPQVWDIAATQFDAPTFVVDNHTRALTLSKILNWDPVKLTNQGFELASGSDPTLPARWSRFLSTPATAYKDNVDKKSGNYGLALISNGASWQKLEQVWSGYEPATSYVLTFDGKTDLSGADGRVWIYDETTATTIASLNFTNTTWQTHTLTFTSPANQTDVVKIQLGHKDYTVSNGKTSYDNVSIKRSGDSW